MGDLGFLPDRRDRKRHRQGAARPGGGQHRPTRESHLSPAVGAHQEGHAQGAGQQEREIPGAELAQGVAGRAAQPLQPLRESLSAVARTGEGLPGADAAGVHRGLQQHPLVQTGVRLPGRLGKTVIGPRPGDRSGHHSRTRRVADFQQYRGRALDDPAQHAADRQRATGIRRGVERRVQGRRRAAKSRSSRPSCGNAIRGGMWIR